MSRRNRCLKCNDRYHINSTCAASSETGRKSISKRWKGKSLEERKAEMQPIISSFNKSFKSEKERRKYFSDLGKISGQKRRQNKLGA